MSNELVETILHPGLALDMQKMAEADQAMRTQSEAGDFWDAAVDRKNTERMKEVVSSIGWPTISKVGKEGASNAWLLVQHADHDVGFQEHCLQLMKEAPSGEVDISNIAYLEDRVRINQGRSQRYGTQFIQENSQHVPRPIEDEENVDIRRAEVGMGPLSELIAFMNENAPLKK